MDEVVENTAVQTRLLAVVAQEGVQWVPVPGLGRVRPPPFGEAWLERTGLLAAVLVTHAQGELAQLFLPLGEPVRLQVEQELEPVFGLAQETIGIAQDAVFLVGEAADAFQGLERLDGVPLPHFRQVAAVEKLQKLDGELDVADAAVAGLDLRVAGAGPAGLFFHLPLERLDLVDLGEGQVFAVDKWLNGAQELLTQAQVARHRPQLARCGPACRSRRACWPASGPGGRGALPAAVAGPRGRPARGRCGPTGGAPPR